jgi:Domain of unknown function (DUF1823)
MFETLPPLTYETLWGILKDSIDDDTTHRLVWHYLGYRQNPATQAWENADSEWSSVYPTPPPFIESRPATIKLTRSIPAENKQLLKTQLGFSGYTVNELIPRKTRRATIVNWLLSHAALDQIDLT